MEARNEAEFAPDSTVEFPLPPKVYLGNNKQAAIVCESDVQLFYDDAFRTVPSRIDRVWVIDETNLLLLSSPQPNRLYYWKLESTDLELVAMHDEVDEYIKSNHSRMKEVYPDNSLEICLDESNRMIFDHQNDKSYTAPPYERIDFVFRLSDDLFGVVSKNEGVSILNTTLHSETISAFISDNYDSMNDRWMRLFSLANPDIVIRQTKSREHLGLYIPEDEDHEDYPAFSIDSILSEQENGYDLYAIEWYQLQEAVESNELKNIYTDPTVSNVYDSFSPGLQSICGGYALPYDVSFDCWWVSSQELNALNLGPIPSTVDQYFDLLNRLLDLYRQNKIGDLSISWDLCFMLQPLIQQYIVRNIIKEQGNFTFDTKEFRHLLLTFRTYCLSVESLYNEHIGESHLSLRGLFDAWRSLSADHKLGVLPMQALKFSENENVATNAYVNAYVVNKTTQKDQAVFRYLEFVSENLNPLPGRLFSSELEKPSTSASCSDGLLTIKSILSCTHSVDDWKDAYRIYANNSLQPSEEVIAAFKANILPDVLWESGGLTNAVFVDFTFGEFFRNNRYDPYPTYSEFSDREKDAMDWVENNLESIWDCRYSPYPPVEAFIDGSTDDIDGLINYLDGLIRHAPSDCYYQYSIVP